MKKKIFGLMAIAVITAVAAWNVYVSQSKNEMALSEVALKNVEALAQENDNYTKYIRMVYDCNWGMINSPKRTVCFSGGLANCTATSCP
jgi:hypothetical protein